MYKGREQFLKVSKIAIHEKYETKTYTNDIAIIKLAEQAQFSDFINAACLPKHNEELEVGRKCYVTGKLYTFIISFDRDEKS